MICVHTFEVVCGPWNLSTMCSPWNIMYGLCMHAFEVVSIPLNLCGSAALTRSTKAYVDMQLNLYVAHSTSLGCATLETPTRTHVYIHLNFYGLN